MLHARRHPSGSGKLALVAGLAGLAISAAIFLGYAWPKWFPEAEVEPAPFSAPVPPATNPDSPEFPPNPAIPTSLPKTNQPVGPSSKPESITPSVPPIVGPVEPSAIVETLATAFLAENPAAVQATLGSGVVPENVLSRLADLFSTHNLDTSNAVARLGSQPALQRWALYLIPDRSVSQNPVGPLAVELDFVRDSRSQWWPGAITLPDDAATAPSSAPKIPPEALAAARSVAAALVAGNMANLVSLLDPHRSSPAQATGLAAMLQEGGFSLKPDADPLVTLAGPTQVWLMMPVVSTTWQTESQFGIILRKTNEGASWLVAAFHPDSLLAVTSNRLAAGDPATSLIRNPGQPEGLCLYFSPESAQTDERARRVISLAAAMLDADPTLRIRLLGHTDATENDGYEQKLATARVQSAAQLLLDAGIPPEIIERETYGARRPRRANFLPDGHPDPRALTLNRRVEMIFEKAGG